MTVLPLEKDPPCDFYERMETYEGLVPEVMRDNARYTHGVKERAKWEDLKEWAREIKSILTP